MTFRHWLRGAAALAILTGLGGAAAAQGKLSLLPDESSRFSDIRNGVKQRVREDNKDEAKKNEEAIRRKAQVEVARMLDYASTAGGSGTKPISDVVRGLNDAIIDPRNFGPLKEGQRDMIKIFGEEMITQLKPLIGTADKAGTGDIVVRINAARALSVVAKSGYDSVGAYAAEVLNDPKQHDAVKVYVLQALANLFAVPNPEKEGRSVLNAKDEMEAIKALCAFIARKPTYGADASQEEIDAFRYLRREAVTALGKVRKPIVRDKDNGDKIVAVPAIWLLRVANGDTNLNPPPSLSERIEALAGYLNLQGDKEQNMDVAAWYVYTAIVDLAVQFKEARPPEKPKPDDKKPPERTPVERDVQAWKLASARIEVGLRIWRDGWENLSGVREANIRKMITDLATVADKTILGFMYQGRPNDVRWEDLRTWASNQQFANRTLFNDDPSSVVTRPDAGR